MNQLSTHYTKRVRSPSSSPSAPQVSEEATESTKDQAKKWRLCSNKLHLTYKNHLDSTALIAFLKQKLGEMKWYSLVHENGSTLTEQGTQLLPYAHTHVAFQLVKRVDIKTPLFLDYQGIHPNIQQIKSTQHAIDIVEYHKKAPVFLIQSPNCPKKFDLQSYQELMEATSLSQACSLAGIVPKTVSDLVNLRSHRADLQVIPSLETEFSWTRKAPDNFTSLFVLGKSGTGKTRWAIAQFQSPLLLSHMDDLKQFMPSRHDGLVFDDMAFNKMTPGDVIHLLDWEMPRTLNVKYGSVTIPARTQKIFTSNLNFHDLIPPCQADQFMAIRRRVQIIEVDYPLFHTPSPGVPMEESELTMDETTLEPPNPIWDPEQGAAWEY